jgi:hypothetical protein
VLTPALQKNITEVGVDWVTCTAPADGHDLHLLTRADAIIAEEEAAGNDLERLRWQRYDLKTCGSCSAGVRDDGAIVRLSGKVAREHWWRVVPYARNVSRLDVQVTVRPDPPRPRLGADHLRELLQWRREHPNAPKVTFNGGPDGIECVYVGSRTSQTFARFYDKFAESGDDQYRGCWRYEVETKKHVATRLARALYHHDEPDRAGAVFVWDFFRARGVQPEFGRGNGHLHVSSYVPRADDARRLKWLREQVDPVAHGLVDKGKGDEVLDALSVVRSALWELKRPTDAQEAGDGDR